MRKIMVLIMLLISTLLLISCNNQIKDDRQPFDPMESSIFKIAEVKNARALEDLEVHNSPTYGNPFDMMDEFDIEYQYAGENLAKNTSATKAHTALMNSSGHRKNILNPNFTHVGVGVKKAEQGYIYVEMFIGVSQ